MLKCWLTYFLTLKHTRATTIAYNKFNKDKMIICRLEVQLNLLNPQTKTYTETTLSNEVNISFTQKHLRNTDMQGYVMSIKTVRYVRGLYENAKTNV